MSIHPEFDNPQTAVIGTTPIVFRFQGLHPGDLGRFSMHDERKGGDLSHVDLAATGLNEQLFGAPDWKKVLRREIADATQHNLEEHVAALNAKAGLKLEELTEDRNRLLAERTTERDQLQAAKVERSEQEAARDKASGEVREITLEKEKVSEEVQVAVADLKQAKAETITEMAAAQIATEDSRLASERRDVAEKALEDAKTKRALEEGKLLATQAALKELETQHVDLKSMGPDPRAYDRDQQQ